MFYSCIMNSFTSYLLHLVSCFFLIFSCLNYSARCHKRIYDKTLNIVYISGFHMFCAQGKG